MTPHDLLANFEVLAEAPNGIKRLRELVLELAVRGKLVEQALGEEPAKALLQRIGSEKAKLIREGRIRKGKTLPEIRQDECPFGVPEGWAFCRMIDLGFFLGGKTPSTNVGAYWNGSIPWVSPKDMKVSLIEDTEDHVSEKAIRDGLPLIPQGSVLIVVRSGILRRMVPVAINCRECTINQDLKALWVFPSVKPQYVALMVKGFERFILEHLTKTGTTVESMKFDEFSIQPFLLPPAKEQERILARVDELMALLDRLEAKRQERETARAAARDSALAALRDAPSPEDVETAWLRIQERFHELFATPKDVEPLRQTILQLAVCGRLVPQNHWEWDATQALSLALECVDQRGNGRRGRRSTIESLPVNPNEVPYQVPTGWIWARLGTLGEQFDYGTSEKAHPEPIGIPVLRMNNIQQGKIQLNDLKYIEDTTGGLQALLLKRDDLLFNRTNSYELVGKTGVFMGDDDQFTFASYLIRIRLRDKVIHPTYANLFLNSPVCRRTQIEPEITQQTGQANFNGTKLRGILLPLPPPEEQRRIIAKVDDFMTILDRLAEALSSQESLSGTFSSAIIHNLNI